ncbi:YifB family Mg chelatase-like AAA ATPase [Patescibacteria group bacterium]|nr:YifB family Mg chelatase-like AAA ATPase [Patescibacteria group bacterium]MBU1868667.1 YifB family Mg chelatase-like AAA ATPase [Patescibacteria group bacterium]
MLAKIYSGTILGLEGKRVDVEVDLAKKGFPSFKIVGLPDKAVNEARDRVRSAIINSKADFPKYRLTVNLAPADLPKEGSAFDLPIALGILIASGQLPLSAELEKSVFWGELSLEGDLRSITGALPLTLWAREAGFEQVFLPAVNAPEAAVVKGIKVMPINSLRELFYHLGDVKPIEPHDPVDVQSFANKLRDSEFDLADISGQEQAKRALIIAAAGGHNLFMMGPPGAGKTLLARALPSILPSLTEEEMLEATQIYSVSGNLPHGEALILQRPFRTPHHTTSRIGLIGGGSRPKPGEISLAHRGVLFLDEFAEFPRHVLESLRQPMEDGKVTVSRALTSTTFPAQFMLVAASNPCYCGYLGSQRGVCRCTSYQVDRYQKRVSGPMLDRFDLYLTVPEVEREKLSQALTEGRGRQTLTSAVAREQVQLARDLQKKRFSNGPSLVCNANIGPKEIRVYCEPDNQGRELLKQAYARFRLTARGYHKVLKVARTIADLNGSSEIAPECISEALCYRRRGWG